MSFKPMSDLDRIMPRRILIPGHGLGFKNLSYNVLTKQMKTGVWISKNVYILGNDVSVQSMRDEIMAINETSPARRSKDAIPSFSQETCNPSHNAYPAAAASVVLRSKCTSHYSMVYLWVILYASLVNTDSYLLLLAITGALSQILQFPKYQKRLHHIASFKYLLKALLRNEFKGRERVSGKLEDVSAGSLGEKNISKLHNTTIADLKWNWKLIDKDDFFTVDVYSIENFCISIGILLTWKVLCRLFVYLVRTFYSMKVRK